ncbi:SIR2 family protein [Gimesia aquarii]|uniref:Uncharacterized protein n=1 Tax=Gimesia aquarii TaxID=2527964 RepID=A0A517WWK6_9PLAN|nr:SIR2 family protein [Gimesia aquarii]QDU09624.1 hypothetical protein V202x_30000 [Gimesia aquarii]
MQKHLVKRGEALSTNDFPDDKRDPINVIIEAWRKGRRIVPLLGSGISVESGIPTLSQTPQYLAATSHCIAEGLFDFSFSRSRKKENEKTDRSEIRINQYLQNFGWPDYDSVIWHIGSDINSSEQSQSAFELSSKLDTILKEKMHEVEYDQRALVLSFHEWLKGIKTELSKKARAEFESAIKKQELNEYIPQWKPLLYSLADSNPDTIDSFFRFLVSERKPGVSHRQLASLSKLMKIDLILTINFDSLLEIALREEGLLPYVYDIARENVLPHSSLLSDQLSLFKLHGGAYGLLVGESLDRSLDQESRSRIQSYLKDDSLLVLLGIGGNERRVNEIVDISLPLSAANGSEEQTRAIWIHRSAIPEYFAGRPRGAFLTKQWYDPGKFLTELYFRAAKHQTRTRVPYAAHTTQPHGLESPRVTDAVSDNDNHKKSDAIGFSGDELFRKQPFHIVSPPFESDPSKQRRLCDISQKLQELARNCRGYRVLWIDCESFQTIGGLVSHILEACRNSDRKLPHIVQPTGTHERSDEVDKKEKPSSVKKAIRSVRRALSRDTYVLVLDSMGSFARPMTLHHGVVKSSVERTGYRLQQFQEFIEALILPANNGFFSGIGSSAICLGLTPVTWRFQEDITLVSNGPHDTELGELFTMELKWRQRLKKISDKPKTRYLYEWHEFDYAEHTDDALDILRALGKSQQVALNDDHVIASLLSVFRRPRNELMVRELLYTFFTSPTSDDNSIEQRIEQIVTLNSSGLDSLQRLEGGYIWFRNDVRDSLYAKLSKFAPALTTDGKPRNEEDNEKIIQTLITLVSIHRFAADYYYNELFLASHDPEMFLEYLYHQVSFIRQLTSLNLLLSNTAFKKSFDKFTKQCQRNKVPLYSQFWEYLFAQNTKGKLRKYISNERSQHICSLRDCIERERDFILTSFPADRALEAISSFLTEDLQRISLTYQSYNTKWKELKESRDSSAEEIERFFWTLSDLRARVLREKCDFGGCIRERLKQLLLVVFSEGRGIDEKGQIKSSIKLDSPLPPAEWKLNKKDNLSEMSNQSITQSLTWNEKSISEIFKWLEKRMSKMKPHHSLRLIRILIDIGNCIQNAFGSRLATPILESVPLLYQAFHSEKEIESDEVCNQKIQHQLRLISSYLKRESTHQSFISSLNKNYPQSYHSLLEPHKNLFKKYNELIQLIDSTSHYHARKYFTVLARALTLRGRIIRQKIRYADSGSMESEKITDRDWAELFSILNRAQVGLDDRRGADRTSLAVISLEKARSYLLRAQTLFEGALKKQVYGPLILDSDDRFVASYRQHLFLVDPRLCIEQRLNDDKELTPVETTLKDRFKTDQGTLDLTKLIQATLAITSALHTKITHSATTVESYSILDEPTIQEFFESQAEGYEVVVEILQIEDIPLNSNWDLQDKKEDLFLLCSERIRRAESTISEATKWLTGGRRNVWWWRELALLRAEVLLLKLLYTISRQSIKGQKERTDIRRQFIEALTAISEGVDCIHVVDEITDDMDTSIRRAKREFKHVHLGILVAFTCLTAKYYVTSNNDVDVDKVYEEWSHLNDLGGLPKLRNRQQEFMKDQILDCAKRLKQVWVESRDIDKNSEPTWIVQLLFAMKRIRTQAVLSRMNYQNSFPEE